MTFQQATLVERGRLRRGVVLAGAALVLLVSAGITATARAAGAGAGGTAYDGSTALSATGGGQAGDGGAGAGGNYGQPGGGPGGGAAGANGTSTTSFNNAAALSGTAGADGGSNANSGGGAGGAGAVVTGAGDNTNSSTIVGGAGGAGSAGSIGAVGGVAGSLDLSGGGGGAGGSGAVFTQGGTSFTTTGAVTGGNGGGGGTASAALVSTTVFGTSTFRGGGGGAGGIGAVFAGPASRLHGGAPITGGNGGAGGSASIAVVGSPSLGPIFAVAGGGGGGGAGVVFAGAGALVNVTAAIGGGTGGAGGSAASAIVSSTVGPLNSRSGDGGTGGAGLSLSGGGADLSSSAAISGGAGGAGGAVAPAVVSGTVGAITDRAGNGGAGGVGILASGAANTIANTARVAGGAGGAGGTVADALIGSTVASVDSRAGNGGTGGAGLAAGAAARVTNSGTIVGGVGGTGGAVNIAAVGGTVGPTVSQGGNGGAGGVGAAFSGGGGRLTNGGTISGGAGGLLASGGTSGMPGAGGVGLTADRIRIDNAGGTIIGGLSGDGVTRAFAIALTGGQNFVGTGGTINGGIDVQGGAQFQPALPGSPIGTPLQVTGPLRFAQTSTYNIRISPKANDNTNVAGTAALNGASVNVQGSGFGVYQASRRTIVKATAVSGTFGTVSTNLAFLNPKLSYDTTHVFLNISAGGTFVIPGLTQNERNVAIALTNVALQGTSGPGRKIIDALNTLTPQQAPAVLDSLSGEGIAASQNIAFRSAQLFNSAIFDQTTFYGTGGASNSVTLTAPVPGFTALATPEQTLAAANAGQKVREVADLPSSKVEPAMPAAVQRTWRAWGTGFGGVEDIQGNRIIGSAAQNNSIIGGALGVDYQLLPNYLVGVAVGGTDGTFLVPGRGTSGSTTGGHVAFYDIATFGKFYGASSSSFSYYGNKTTRFTGGFGGLASEQERGNFDSHEFRTRLEFGRHFDNEFGFGSLGALTPFLALEIAELRSNGFNESALSGPSLLGLNVQGQSIASVPAFVGLRLQRVVALGGLTLSPTLQVAYVHEFAPYRSQMGQIASLPGSVFLVDGARPARDAAQVKAGGELSIGPRAALFANFDGEFSGINQLYAGKGGFRYLW